MQLHARSFVLVLGPLVLASSAMGQDRANAGPGSGQGSARPGPSGAAGGVSRESMWWAPTAEDWKRPCLITWQRSYEDALAVSRETQKPILVCVNMDGEIASEHYAGVRYRQAETAALYEPYVCVIASVYRHTPRDHDETGRRILCPRFGSVTCGEHIAIEPGLFDQLMDGQRVAPRHIGVELDQRELYDVYYAFDTDTVFDSLREAIEKRTIVTRPVVRGDRPVLERVASRDGVDRTTLERAYLEGDQDTRRGLLQAARAQVETPQIDLLRLAVFGFDVELARLGRSALAEARSEGAIDLIAEALRVPMEASERDALIAALFRIGATSPRARTLAAVHQGLAGGSSTLDVEGSDILASLRRRPEAAASLDGLNLSPVDTARMLRARLSDLGRDDLVARLQGALDQLDPELLLLPAYEGQGPASGESRPPRRRRVPAGE